MNEEQNEDGLIIIIASKGITNILNHWPDYALYLIYTFLITSSINIAIVTS